MAASSIYSTIAAQPREIVKMNDAFVMRGGPHALIVNTQGYACPGVPQGATDSGGQLTYINYKAREMAKLGFKVTVAARSFRPETEDLARASERRGVEFMPGTDGAVRFVYVPGAQGEDAPFVRKEDLYQDLPHIGANLAAFIDAEAALKGVAPWEHVSLIDSHYIDGGIVGQHVVAEWHRMVDGIGGISQQEALGLKQSVNRHAFTPHSLGLLKMKNMIAAGARERNPAEYLSMNFETREAFERAILKRPVEAFASSAERAVILPQARAFVATSDEILETAYELAMPRSMPVIMFEPGTDPSVYFPRESVGHPEISALLDHFSAKSLLPSHVISALRERPQEFTVVVDAARMDRTKRKDMLIEAMAPLGPGALLFITGKRDGKGVYDGLAEKIRMAGLGERVFLLGRVPEPLMGPLMSLPYGEGEGRLRMAIVASASRMEGWGMSVQDGTLGGMPLVASPYVPYAMHLARRNDAALIVQGAGERSDEVAGYTAALRSLMEETRRASEMAERGREIAQYYRWDSLTSRYVNKINELFFGAGLA